MKNCQTREKLLKKTLEFCKFFTKKCFTESLKKNPAYDLIIAFSVLPYTNRICSNFALKVHIFLEQFVERKSYIINSRSPIHSEFSGRANLCFCALIIQLLILADRKYSVGFLYHTAKRFGEVMRIFWRESELENSVVFLISFTLGWSCKKYRIRQEKQVWSMCCIMRSLL